MIGVTVVVDCARTLTKLSYSWRIRDLISFGYREHCCPMSLCCLGEEVVDYLVQFYHADQIEPI